MGAKRFAVAGALALAIMVLAPLLSPGVRAYYEEALFRAQGVVARGPEAPLRDLTVVQQLSAAFNAAEGHPRLLLFLSPT